MLGYDHIGDYFLTAFYKKSAWIPHLDVRHSIVDYKAVLGKALVLPDQIFVGTVTGVNNILLQSVTPPVRCSTHRPGEVWHRPARRHQPGADPPDAEDLIRRS